MKNIVKYFSILGIIIFSLLSCKTAPSSAQLSGILRGHVRYLERIALPGDFWLEVQLVEVKPDGTAGSILARAMTEKPTRVIPVPFMMRYSPKAVTPGAKKYGLIASIYVGKQLWFMNQKPYPVFQGKDDQIDIIAQRVLQ